MKLTLSYKRFNQQKAQMSARIKSKDNPESTGNKYSKYPKRVNVIKPLIPESILDANSQRYYVLALFVLIQAWKTYDLLLLQNYDELSSSAIEFTGKKFGLMFLGISSPRLSFVFKYFTLDSLLILVVPFLNIPKLAITPSFSIALLLILNSLTVFLTCANIIPITSIFYSIYKFLVPDKELAILENYVDTEAIFDQSEHFKGKKTIRYAPDSTVRINPYDQRFCIRPVYNDKIKIPIKVDSVYDLTYLQLEYRDFNDDVMLFNFTSKDIKNSVVTDYYNSPYFKYDPSVLADSNVQLLEIPVDLPGYYSIKVAADKKNKQIRSYKSNTVIPVCPEAYFNPQPSFVPDKCQQDAINDMEITVLGVPPFTLYYEEEVNGVLSKLPPTKVFHPQYKDSPLNSNDEPKKINYQPNYLRDLSWAKSCNITLPMGSRILKETGTYIYTINKVVDGFGNIISYTPDPRDKSTFLSFNSHPKPVLSLIDSNRDIPILVDREKWLNITIANAKSISQESPFDVQIKFISNDEASAETINQHFDLQKSSYMSVFAKNPGTYIIERGSSKYCDCIIGEKSVIVSSAMLPRMNVSLEPIVDNCVGTTGFKFDFDFVGSPPFEIDYKISKLDPNSSNKVLRVEKTSRIRSDTFTHEFEFKPSSEGSYAIELISLSDKYYKNKVKFSQGEYRYVTYFKQRPKAYFRKNTRMLKSCFNQSLTVPLVVEGTPPFKIKYELIYPDGSFETFELKNVSATDITLTTPQFSKGGTYTLILREVYDSSDCEVEFKGQEVHIDVNNEVPKISFPKSENIEIVRGSYYIVQLHTESNQPIDLTYTYSPLNKGKTEIVELKSYDPSRGLRLSKEGSYKLTSFKQDGCPGEIAYEYEAKVHYLPFPSIHAVTDHTVTLKSEGNFFKDKVCLNQAGNIMFELNGSPPFVIEYQVIHPNGRKEDKAEKINGSQFGISLHTYKEGLYRYVIKNIYDSVYTEDILNRLSFSSDYKFSPLTFIHEVIALPSAKFINDNHKIQACVSALNTLEKLESIKVLLEGNLPATLKVDIYRELDGSLETLVFDNLQSSIIDLITIYDHIRMGSNVISVNQVVDANGCISDANKVSSESITVIVNDIPKIRQMVEDSNQPVDSNINSHYYCVGDQISYMLNGVPPFNLKYEFSGVVQEAEIHSNYFKRRAPGPGELKMISLSDSSAKDCVTELGEERNDLKAIVYDLPSVEIVQGDSIEEDIHEGEQVEIKFLLTGTPPFKLTYIRKELDDNSKIVETEIVEDIQDMEYRIMTSLEGTYEAIEIQDRYCAARNHRI